jgi:carbon storage regulator CsrA
MINKQNIPDKYLKTLKNQIVKEPDSLLMNSKISTFLINQGRLEEARPFLTKQLDIIAEKKVSKSFRVTDRTTAFKEDIDPEIQHIMKSSRDVTKSAEKQSISLTKRKGEKVTIDNQIDVIITEVDEQSVTFTINYPKDSHLSQDNVYEHIKKYNQQAIKTNIHKLKEILATKNYLRVK